MIHNHVTIIKADCNDVILLEVLENIDKIHTHFEFKTCDQIHCKIFYGEISVCDEYGYRKSAIKKVTVIPEL